MTATLTPQPKRTDDRARRSVLLPDRPVRPGDRDTVVGERLPVPAALLAEGVTKRFQVERKKPPVIAIAGVTMRLDRGEMDDMDPGSDFPSRSARASDRAHFDERRAR